MWGCGSPRTLLVALEAHRCQLAETLSLGFYDLDYVLSTVMDLPIPSVLERWFNLLVTKSHRIEVLTSLYCQENPDFGN